MSTEPDTHELARRVTRLDELFDELHKIVGSVLEWKDKISGGLSVMLWVVGAIQSIVLLCLGFAANSLNHTATVLGQHAVELATTRTKMESFMVHPRFTAEHNAIADAEIKAWVKEEIEHKHAKP